MMEAVVLAFGRPTTVIKTTMSAANRPIGNPYAAGRRPLPINADNNMGRQSQHRVANQHKRKYKLCSNSSNKKRRQGDQLTLQGAVAFQSERDCLVCKAKSIAKFCHNYRIPKRAHHQLCLLNKTTKGAGPLTSQGVANLVDDKRYKQLTRPVEATEKMSAAHLSTGGATFFAPRQMTTTTISDIPKEPMATQTKATQEENVVSPSDLCEAVIKRVDNPEFREKHKNKSAPLAMIAFAEEVVDKIIRPKATMEYFDGMTMTVPTCQEAGDNPHYHSIVGQKLLLVDWERVYGLEVHCPNSTCNGVLNNTRTNFSKNKTLFPIFGLDGPPAWCIVQSMTCSCCRRQFAANDGEVLVNLPTHVADDYPVETTYATNSTSHIARNAAEVFASIMITYGNGELCSKLLYDAVNRAYIGKIKGYYSLASTKRKESATKPYIEKDGSFIRQYPPLGDTIRDLYNTAASSTTNRWRLSDFERNTREMQGVNCDGGIFAQDHTFEPIKNYLKGVGAKAAWDAATQTGEIASAVLVPSTKTMHFAHAAQSLLRRPHFKPKVMYSDTWPNKEEYWEPLGVEGRLGLFHYQKRIISTLRKNHVDYFDAITDLLAALYAYHPEDYARLLSALKDGSLSKKGTKYTSSDITAMKGTRLFRDRYAKYLRKQMHPHTTIVQMLDDWFCKYKVTSSNPDKPGHGRLDPIRLVPLFTEETKPAVENCKQKAQYLTDPLPINEMYHEILPNPNASHRLSEFLSNRGESKLEAFHDRFSHFANCGMRESLADNLNLAGTARYNLSIRHVRSLASKNENPQVQEARKKIPAAWEKIVPFFNHSELWYVNNMAKSVGCQYPFPQAEVLVPDNGERFFSQYITITLPSIRSIKPGPCGECLCSSCMTTTSAQAKPWSVNNEPHHESGNNNQEPAAVTPTTTINLKKPARTRKTRQPTQCAIAKSPNYQMPMPAYNQQICYMPQLIPMQYQLPLYYVPQIQPCCGKYAEWMKRRLGRPPHHSLCPNR